MTGATENNLIQKIDVREVFRDKSPGIARFIPGFVYRYLERFLHLDWFNPFMEKQGHKSGMEFLEAVFEEYNVKMIFVGKENLPKEGRFLFVSNHPLGGFDGNMLTHLLRSHYPKVTVLVNDVLMNIKNMEELFVPINKHGGQARDNVRLIEGTYASEAQILSFPSMGSPANPPDTSMNEESGSKSNLEMWFHMRYHTNSSWGRSWICVGSYLREGMAKAYQVRQLLLALEELGIL